MDVIDISKATNQTLLDLFLEALQRIAQEFDKPAPNALDFGELEEDPSELILKNLQPLCRGKLNVHSGLLVVDNSIGEAIWSQIGTEETWTSTATPDRTYVVMAPWLAELWRRLRRRDEDLLALLPVPV